MNPKSISQLSLAIACILQLAASLVAQERTLVYSVSRKNNIVGSVTVTQQITGNQTVIRLESDINARLIFTLKARTIEESVFRENVMIRSSLYRELNGKEKVKSLTLLQGDQYLIKKPTRTEYFTNSLIRYNMLSLYFYEPRHVSQVYSDNFQQHLDIQKIADRHYRVHFPDGSHNEYYYEDGICTGIRVYHTFYSAQIDLKM